ncbi:VCBS repeat-containing protein [Streptomyces jumonjinensis]|uniref:VCBS repeat-containing protein n=1 Tax=Streptomyces jumonjinensis TaxID=1945 RepID=UPI0037899C1E
MPAHPKAVKRARTSVALAALTAAALTGGLLAVAAAPAAARADTAYDLNKDGYRDLVTAAPDATVAGAKKAGAVVVQYGSASGPGKRVVLTQNSPGVPGTAEAGDRFGAAVAVADYDGDGHQDLFAGSPGESLGSDTGAGSLVVLWGAKSGPGKGVSIPEPDRYRDAHGRSFAVADFTGDGAADLALGGDDCWVYTVHGDGDRSIPQYTGGISADCYGGYGIDALTAVEDGGRSHLIVTGRGSGTLLFRGTSANGGLDHGHPLPSGSSVAVADFNRDGRMDAAIGDPDAPGGGRVSIVHGVAGGVSPATVIDQSSAGVPGTAEAGDRFGAAVWAGDITKDGHRELVIGAPGEDLGAASDAGQITVVRGTAAGLDTTGATAYTQSTQGVPGGSERGDRFGSAVLLADVTKDGYGDLAIGAEGENSSAGALTWLRGTSKGLTTSGALTVSAPAAGLSGAARFGALFTR